MSEHPSARLPTIPELTDEYLLLSELGRGGSAVVYLARDQELGREVAVKLVRSPLAGDDESRARFNREARTAALLHHPNIVGVHAVKRLADGGLALVMQYVPGGTLKQMVRQVGPLDFGQIEKVIRDISAALAYAHDRGVVHRDVKPENIFLHQVEGRALLADFGIARTAETNAGLTLEGVAIGTPAYMAPEHIDGSSMDGRADLYSLGMVAWEMVTGEAPWEGESLYSIIYKQKHVRLPPVTDFRPDVPFHLQYLIEKLTQKDRERRCSDARELIHTFETALRANRWKQWRMKREVDRGSSGVSDSPSIPTPAAVITSLGSPAAGRVHDVNAAGETVRYRRPDQPSEVPQGEQPSPVRETAQPVAVVPMAAVPFVPPEPWTGSSSAVWSASRETEKPKLLLRRLPASAAILAVVLFTGLGATLFALGIPQPENPARGPAEVPDQRVLGDATRPTPPLGFGQVDATEAAGSELELVPSAEIVTDAAVRPDSVPRAEAEQSAAVPEPEPPSEVEVVAAPPPVARPVHRFPARPIISAGGLHTCSVAPSGDTYCWGGNSEGQVGNGGSSRSPGPVRLAAHESFREIAAGFSHTCGVTTDGSMMCWGANESGQLGVGSLAPRPTPSVVAPAGSFETVSTGRSHTCALTGEGEVFCWGSNSFGQLGDRSRTSRTNPVRVVTREGITAISAGWNHTCALTNRGMALCWGQNSEGQLGNDATADHNVPTAVSGRRAFSRVTAGGAHTCGLASNGAAFCWGRNSNGQLGDGSTIRRAVPVRVDVSVGFVGITAGGVHTCALTAEGEAFCWGLNSYGQLGDGTTVDRLAPTRVDFAQRFVSLHASGSHTCGTTQAGERFCWGYNLEGQLGDGTRAHQPRPVPVATLQG